MRAAAVGVVGFALMVVTACGDPAATAPPTPTPRAGGYLGETPPELAPELFAPGFVSTGLYERDLAWTPDGAEAYWTVYSTGHRSGTVVAVRQRADGTWTEPFIPEPFRGSNSIEPFVTVDGAWLYFASDRPLPGESASADWNLWRAPRVEDGWGPAAPLAPPVTGDGDEFYPSLTADGVLYYTAELDDSLGGEDLYRSRPTAGGWAEPENLGPAVNSPGPEFNSLVHPGGDWILFGSAREGDAGRGDLYVAFADGAGGWTDAAPLPPPIASPALDFCPALSPDGRLLFFTSTRTTFEPTDQATYGDLAERLSAPGNGHGDLWWVDVRALDLVRTN